MSISTLESAAREPQMLAALKCAANVLFLLSDEVKALGHQAENVPAMVNEAIASATPTEEPA